LIVEGAEHAGVDPIEVGKFMAKILVGSLCEKGVEWSEELLQDGAGGGIEMGARVGMGGIASK